MLAQGVKFTDFFFDEKNTQIKLPQVFFTSAPRSCVSLRDFVKLIVGAFFIFVIKMSWKKKSFQLPAWSRRQPKCAATGLARLPLAKSLRGLLVDTSKNVYFLKMTKTERILEPS